jgi:DNA mismatch repair protein MutL
MNRIRLLSEQVANQIAAGEVVERPASVVKELVENSLDAGATRITVEIQAGGRSLIRVTDDGVGMSKDDALLCLERHATSKIQRAEDLAAISTMGFRGEAMPSIASVSRMTIISRERDNDSAEACQVVIHGGKILEVKAAGAATGTMVEVRQLFYNLPARRKFLRTEETERAHIQHYLTLAALAAPEIAFTFIQDGRVQWQLPGLDTSDRIHALKERMRAIQGGETNLLPLEFRTEFETPLPLPKGEGRGEGPLSDNATDIPHAEYKPFRVWGVIGAPGVSRATREDQHVFVNRRPVENRGINFALIEGYHNSLMKGRYPVCCLFIELDPADVDVNIHPAKREVKFHNEMAVRRAVAQAVRETLTKFHTASNSRAPATDSEPRYVVPPLGGSASSNSSAPISTQGPPAKAGTTYELELQPEAPSQPTPEQRPLALPPAYPTRPIENWPHHPLPQPSSPLLSSPASSLPSLSSVNQNPVALLHVPLRIVGVIGRLYVIMESDRGMVLLDQHAAHERVLFEEMLKRMEQGAAASQRLLLPETVELSAKEAQFLKVQLPTLQRLGVGLSEFGERTFLLDALPPFIKVPDARRFVIELIDALKSAGQDVNTWRLGEHMIAKTVCRHAVKANDPLSGPELESLVDSLRRCDMPYTCPHGRPTLIEMNYRELERKFGRAQ